MPKIIAYESGIAAALLGINQTKATVLFSRSNFADATISSFVRVDANDSTLAQSRDPSIATAPNNDIIIVWSQTNLNYSRIFISSSSDKGDSFSTPMPITGTATGNQTGAEIAVAGEVIYVVWTEFVPGKDTDIFLARSLDNGLSFDIPVRVDHTGSSRSIQGFPEVAARGNDVFVAWHDNRNGALNIYGAISHDQGQTFGPSGDVKISDDPGNTEQTRPDVVYLRDGRILVIWQDRRTGDYDVRGAISTGSNSFSSSFLISDGPANKDQSDPRIAVDSRGFTSVTWRDNRLRIAYHIFESSSLDGINYGDSKRVDNAPNATNCFSPDITISGNGSTFVAWSDDRTGISEVYIKALPNLAPHIIITSPVEGSARNGLFPILCEASDPEGSPQLSVQVQLQNSMGSNLTPWTDALAYDGIWSASINSSHFANGNYKIAARSFDGLVYSSMAIVNVTFDNTRPPYVELTLTPDRVQFLPNDPMALQNVTITAEVYNIGTKNATDVLVRFSWLNDTTSGIIDEQLLANIPSGDHAIASVNWTSFQGNLTIFVEVDPMNEIVEDNKANNTISKMIHVESSRPDITVTPSTITILPDLIYSGDSINISAVIANEGEKVAMNFDVTIKVNSTLISTTRIEELLPHRSVTVIGEWIAVGGPRTLQVNADPQHLLDDARFGNNVANLDFDVMTDPRPSADLMVANGTLLVSPIEPMEGDLLIFSILISNIGNAPAYDVNATFYLDGEAIAYRSITQINGSESVGISVTWIAILGQHNVSVAIDPNHLIPERNETNNAAIKSYVVIEWGPLIADLAVSQIDIVMEPTDPIMGNVVWINVTVLNVGKAGVSNFIVQGSMDGDELGHILVNYLPANSSVEVAFTWFANEGQHTFQVTIDPSHTVTESTTSNNTATKTFGMAGPTDSTSLLIAAGFVAAAFAVMAIYVIRIRKK